MRALKSVVYAFLIGGLFALVSQTITTFWGFALGEAGELYVPCLTLISMGVIGFVMAGFAIYQYFIEWSGFGGILPFSGFAVGVGMEMLGPWFKGASTGKSIWAGVFLLLWFNIIVALITILIGVACGMAGITAEVAPATEGVMIFPMAYVGGGIMCAVFQILFLLAKGVYKKTEPIHMLVFGWLMGAILAPTGLCGSMLAIFGQGFGIMLPVGGYQMYSIGYLLAQGGAAASEGLAMLGAFGLAILGLFFTGLGTFLLYRANFGRKTVDQVHLERARAKEEHYKTLVGEE